MKRLKLLGVTLVALCAMGLMAASAFALPDISVTLGGVFPLHLEYNNATNKTKLESASGVTLSGEGLKVTYGMGALAALGTFKAIFSRVVKGTEKCENTATEGEVATEGEFHIVYTSLSPLTLGTLYLVTELTGATEINCTENANKVKVKGDVIGAINLGSSTEATQFTGLKNHLSGTKGKQEFHTFYNDSGTAVTAKLEGNTDGAGYKESNQVVEGEPEATAEGGKMFVITSR